MNEYQKPLNEDSKEFLQALELVLMTGCTLDEAIDSIQYVKETVIPNFEANTIEPSTNDIKIKFIKDERENE